MNSKYIVAVVILVVVIVGLVIFLGGKKDTAISQLQNDISVRESEMLPEGTYTVSIERTTGLWEGKKTLIDGYKDEGTIKVKSGTIVVSEGRVSGGKVVMDMDSIMAVKTGTGVGAENLTRHLKSKDFFDVATYPTSTFELKIPPIEDGRYIAGDLEVKGKKGEVLFPAQMYMENGELRIKGVAVIDRTKWGIIYGSGSFFDNLKNNVIDDNFTVAFDLVATK